MSIELIITPTYKGYSRNAQWMRDCEEHQGPFADLKEAEKYLRTRYGTCKREKMYRDVEGRTPIHCGYIFGFRNSDLSHYPVAHWLQQDWVSFREVKPVDLAA